MNGKYQYYLCKTDSNYNSYACIMCTVTTWRITLYKLQLLIIKIKKNEWISSSKNFIIFLYLGNPPPAISTFEGSVVGYKFGNNCCRRLSNLHHFLGHSCRNNEEVEDTLQQRLRFKENSVQFFLKLDGYGIVIWHNWLIVGI